MKNWFSFIMHRCTTAAGLTYQGTFTINSRKCRIYSSQPALEATKEFMKFEGGMTVGAHGIGDGDYGRVVGLFSKSDGKVAYFDHDCGRKGRKQCHTEGAI